jgi:periplasmic protein TonB
VSIVTKHARRAGASMVALSLALHGVAWAAVARTRPPPARERIELEVVRREAPVAPPPTAPERTEPPPRPAQRVAMRAMAPAPAPLPAAKPAEPPPALASAPQALSPDAPRALPRVGISLGSTVASGGFAVGIGNTLHGRPAEVAADPATVRPYTGGVPAARLSSRPRVLELPKIDYPLDARHAGVEGHVVLLLRIDLRGAVVAVRVVDAPTPSLARAAEEGARRFRFTPALLEGEPVETEIRFTYTFLLE